MKTTSHSAIIHGKQNVSFQKRISSCETNGTLRHLKREAMAAVLSSSIQNLTQGLFGNEMQKIPGATGALNMHVADVLAQEMQDLY